MKNTTPRPPREEIVKLRNAGLNREQIAEHYGVSVPRVKRWIADYAIPSPRRNKKPKIQIEEVVDDDDGLTIVEKAQKALGKRMSEDYRGYLLDGRPVRVDVLIKAAGLSIQEI